MKYVILANVDGKLTPVELAQANVGEACPKCGEQIDSITVPNMNKMRPGRLRHRGWPTCPNGHQFMRSAA